MSDQVRARYADGKLEPLEPLDLAEGCEVLVEISQQELGQGANYPDYVNWILAEQASWPASEREGPPTDLARNKKHYLYGQPKEAGD